MAVTMRQKLSAMLDADLDRADANGKESLQAADVPMMEAVPERPGTIAEWLPNAPAEELRQCLKALVAEREHVRSQVQTLMQEELAHQNWVGQQEKEWTRKPEAQPAAIPDAQKAAPAPMDAANAEDSQPEMRYVPLRLTAEERTLLGILEGALYVSEYTDQVDVYHIGNKSRRMGLQIQQVCAILAGLVVSNNFDVARRPLMERGFSENQHFFRSVFEIGRRYKILNPDKLRGGYGKLIHMLQDSVKADVARFVEFECVAPVKTVSRMVQAKQGGAELLQDPLLNVATREIYDEGRSRAEVLADVKEKAEALKELKQRYAKKPAEGAPAPKPQGDLAELLRGRQQQETSVLTEADVEQIVASISDHHAFQRFNREPCDRILGYLKAYFSPSNSEPGLEIQRGRAGSCLTHNHRTQYTFVMQSLLLWREIMGNMFRLWQMTEQDLLDPDSTYRLSDTGQGLNRMQSAPRVYRAMHQILHKVQSEVGGWVGLSVVHLGDRDVPNALTFIDKYTQVPRILAPLVRTLDRIPQVYAESPANKALFDREFGGVEPLRTMILQDFFRHGFDGSGDDGGSCVDGRLTSCWNWCSKIEKKRYFPAFLLTGFTSFDGGFETGLS
mmetsp:Transcript_116939/g.330889  ORF Transcript_116939/g.330889 Transcript_116939/m.330889 type:complete len:616 (+) Transcript_116939:106-1953(+)